MTRRQLVDHIFSKQSYLCVGLDTDVSRIPKHLLSAADPIFEFNRAIIDATVEHAVAYKINTAFYEAEGVKGWESMQRTVEYIPSTHFKIADAKRGDIGNTSAQYAKAFFETLNFDAITVAPYMGEDSVKPFLEFPDKWTIVLGLTSNPGAQDFEMQQLLSTTEVLEEGIHFSKVKREYLYERVLKTMSTWGTEENMMFVVGATQGSQFQNIRSLTPGHFYLVPGVGSQGGSLEDISRYAMNKECSLLVNLSRAIIYASDKEDFAEQAGNIAADYRMQMKLFLSKI